jgi:hypothetical protein
MPKPSRMSFRVSELAMFIPFMVGLAVGLSGCSGSTMPTPSTGPPRYDGEWSGMTSQGRPISFTVSAGQKVTTITLGYSFNGCSGTKTFPGLSLDIGNPPNPGSPSGGPGFGYGSGPPDAPNYTQVYGTFASSTTVNGSVVFGDYTNCGNGIAIWTATKK